MVLADAHCDTITRLLDSGEGLFSNNRHVDLSRSLSGFPEGNIRFFAIFSNPSFGTAYGIKRFFKAVGYLWSECESYKDIIMLCRDYIDIMKCLDSHKTAAILALEGGEILLDEPCAVDVFHFLGIRSVCLTWNQRNGIADGVMEKSSHGGITDTGREIIAKMNRKGILADLSHISEKGFWDALEISETPVLASHSNAYAVCPHPRNLNDNQIKALAENGGFMGINLYSRHLSIKRKANIDDVIGHIDHVCGLAGSGFAGLGTDFDGMDECPENINGIQDIYKLFERMACLNYSDDNIEAFAGGNLMRYLERNMKTEDMKTDNI